MSQLPVGDLLDEVFRRSNADRSRQDERVLVLTRVEVGLDESPRRDG